MSFSGADNTTEILQHASNIWDKIGIISIISIACSNVIATLALMVAILIKATNRNRREFLLYAAMAFNDLIYNLGFIHMAIPRLIDAFEGKILWDHWTCSTNFAFFLLLVSFTPMGLLTLTAAFNIFHSTYKSLIYIKRTHQYTAGLFAVPIIAMAVLVHIQYQLMGRISDQTQCFPSLKAAMPIIMQYMFYIQLISLVGSLILYKGSEYAVNLEERMPRHLSAYQQLSPVQRIRLDKSITTFKWFSLSHVAFLLVPQAVLFFVPLTNPVLITLLYSMTLIKTIVNFGINMKRNREIRVIVLKPILTPFLGRYPELRKHLCVSPFGTSPVVTSICYIRRQDRTIMVDAIPIPSARVPPYEDPSMQDPHIVPIPGMFELEKYVPKTSKAAELLIGKKKTPNYLSIPAPAPTQPQASTSSAIRTIEPEGVTLYPSPRAFKIDLPTDVTCTPVDSDVEDPPSLERGRAMIKAKRDDRKKAKMVEHVRTSLMLDNYVSNALEKYRVEDNGSIPEKAVSSKNGQNGVATAKQAKNEDEFDNIPLDDDDLPEKASEEQVKPSTSIRRSSAPVADSFKPKPRRCGYNDILRKISTDPNYSPEEDIEQVPRNFMAGITPRELREERPGDLLPQGQQNGFVKLIQVKSKLSKTKTED